MKNFPIITTSRNNIEWARSFLVSLSKTLYDRSRPIYFLDGSNEKNFKALQNMNKYGLNVKVLASPVDHHAATLLHFMKLMDDKFVCFCDLDIVFLLKHWDKYFCELGKQGYVLMGVAPRYKTYIECALFLGVRECIIESQLCNLGGMDWDDNVMTKPPPWSPTNVGGEFIGPTYYHFKNGYSKIIAFPEHWRGHYLKSRLGVVCFDDQGRELIYHNFYSARIKPNATCPIPEAEKKSGRRANFYSNIENNAEVLYSYMHYIWPYSLIDFIKKSGIDK